MSTLFRITRIIVLSVAVIVGRDGVADVKKSFCFLTVSKDCTFSVVNVTLSVEIVEVAGKLVWLLQWLKSPGYCW